VVKIIARLELDETISFPDGHYLISGWTLDAYTCAKQE